MYPKNIGKKIFIILRCIFCEYYYAYSAKYVKETKSATMNIFRFFYFLFKSFVKVK